MKFSKVGFGIVTLIEHYLGLVVSNLTIALGLTSYILLLLLLLVLLAEVDTLTSLQMGAGICVLNLRCEANIVG